MAPRRLRWSDAVVAAVRSETASARTLTLDVDGWTDHVAGQHVDLRLTADDGYQATRSYSLSSPPGAGPEITVERVDDGEVSPFLVDEVLAGDRIEVRGPVGGYFVWPGPEPEAPILLVGGGSGLAPLRAMWRAAVPSVPVAVVVSVRTADRLLFADELRQAPFDVRIHLTREAEPPEGMVAGRVDAEAVAAGLAAVPDSACYVCGPTAFVEAAAGLLVDAGVPASQIRTERFG